MARVGYDSLEGILRVTSAGDKEPDQFVVDVLTYHAALEIEMDQLLARLLPRAECLRAGGLGFRQKISIINAAWPGLPEAGALLADVLSRFNDLRNAVAHADQRRGVETTFGGLVAACARINPDQGADPSPYDIAVSVCAFMGDDAGAQRVLRMLDNLDDVINRRLPRSLGTFRDEDD
ncbi:hypothetical protein [Rhizobium ruizarguesonis]|uniref:hypothetical protein n=1 Tax=Rhizobium ruizarguesonis TaxID=2081791 RepID=UPI001030B486|nr:hypothetical protein [Rhizobium ruizarguesonis]TBD80710.1 hypothetical protein ELH11_12790 [Rhizobium ruizarguesonis]TBE11871.1 hypothetical protein ELH09_12865 [Rhizobium ruizarguesonis]TBE23754.1 hypothetical protein ELH08_13095 [Rhizobium ruizarguesonis]TBE33595.1 hypothetical protein ELH07_13565 [Rhizobium ruizarguesonis]WSG99982.1 hypothetical protein U8P71_15305 [Rhizobium ruizarguesonis]